MAFFLVLTQYSWFCFHQTLPEYQECLLTDTGFTVNYLDNAFALPKGSPFRWHVSNDGSDRKIITGQKKSVQLFKFSLFSMSVMQNAFDGKAFDGKCLWWKSLWWKMPLHIFFQAFVQPCPDEDGGVRRIATDHWVMWPHVKLLFL